MNAEQAFEEAARYMGRTGHEHFTRRASEVEAEDRAWTEEARRLAFSILAKESIMGMIVDAQLLARMVLNAIGEAS